MNKKTPFLTGFSTLLCGRKKNEAQAVLAREREAMLAGVLDIQGQFMDEIDPDLLVKHSATERVRCYPNPLTFWAFLSQVACDDASCADAVARVQHWAAEGGLPVPAKSTSSYCEARAALPVEMLVAVNQSLCSQLDANLPEGSLWRGLRPRAEDGTSAQMPDTDANRSVWSYASGQEPGCGFPTMRLGGLIDLSHGGLCDFASSELKESELRAHEQLEKEHLREGDLLIADRLYSGYELICGLHRNGVHFIGRTHQARKIDFRKGRKAGPNERIVTWRKPRQAPSGSQLSWEEWEALPATLEVRIIRTKGPDRQGRQKVRYVVTTLLDGVAYPAEEVASLYFHRWEIEVRFRDIKTTLGMEMLRTKTPEMIRKEVLMHMIVYNLMRLVMLKAGISHGVNHRRLSFRGTQQVLSASRSGFGKLGNRPLLRTRQVCSMLLRIAERPVHERPGRNEPRRVKRRPKCSRWLQKPRHQYFEHFRSDNPPLKILDVAA